MCGCTPRRPASRAASVTMFHTLSRPSGLPVRERQQLPLVATVRCSSVGRHSSMYRAIAVGEPIGTSLALAALAHDTDHADLAHDVLTLDARDLGGAQPAGVQKLQHGAIADPQQRVDAVLGVLGRAQCREQLAQAGAGESTSGSDFQRCGRSKSSVGSSRPPVRQEPAIEDLDRRQVANHRRGRQRPRRDAVTRRASKDAAAWCGPGRSRPLPRGPRAARQDHARRRQACDATPPPSNT